MGSATRTKLQDIVPEGLLVNRSWLKDKNVDRSSVDYYLRSGVLEAVAQGVYRRPGPDLKWQHVVYSLQELGYNVHVGGQTALELQGMAHYLSIQGIKKVQLFGVSKLPGWVNKVSKPVNFELKKPRLFSSVPEQAVTAELFGHWDWSVKLAKPELALLEVFAGVKKVADFEVADNLMGSASNLRPRLVTMLMESCQNILAKRLFLWFAERHHYQWLNKVELDKVYLGSGKRMVVKNGSLDKKYQITVPKAMANGS